MIKFGDIFKNSFLNNYSSENISSTEIAIILFSALVLGCYISLCYRLKKRQQFYSSDIGVSVIAVSIITAAIIVTIQQSIVISLGMVGALSIVRFRTAIKNPMDLVFYYWSISIGIICGAKIIEIAIFTSVFVTISIFLWDYIPRIKNSVVVSLSYKHLDDVEKSVYKTFKEHCRYFVVKSRTVSEGMVEILCEARVRNEVNLSNQLSYINGVRDVCIMSYDGDSVF